jgi:hypothetical protein
MVDRKQRKRSEKGREQDISFKVMSCDLVLPTRTTS